MRSTTAAHPASATLSLITTQKRERWEKKVVMRGHVRHGRAAVYRHEGNIGGHSRPPWHPVRAAGRARAPPIAVALETWRWRKSVNVSKEHGQTLFYVNLPSSWHCLTPRILRCPLRDGYQKLCRAVPAAAHTLLLRAISLKRRVRDPRTSLQHLQSQQLSLPRARQFSLAVLHLQARVLKRGVVQGQCHERQPRDSSSSK